MTIRDRLTVAGYDLFLDRALRAYSRLEGVVLPVTAGSTAVLFNRLGFAFDDALDATSGVPGTRWEELLSGGNVAARWADLEDYLLTISTADRIKRAREFALSELVSGFESYRSMLWALDSSAAPQEVIDAAAVDSGGQLRVLASVIGILFRGRLPAAGTADQFVALGVVAKIIDDLRDVRQDFVGARPNLLLSHMNLDGALPRLTAEVHRCGWPTPDWWRIHAATSLRSCRFSIECAAKPITDPALRICVDILLLSTRGSTRGQSRSAGRA